MSEADVQRERYRGTLLGLAVGNALGLPMEGRSKEQIEARYPRGVHEIEGWVVDAPWDDDVAQAILLAEALLESAPLQFDDLARRLIEWRQTNGTGIGLLTSDVISELEAGTPAHSAARLVWERGGRTSAGNGAVMRCAPIALRWRRSEADLVREARTSALVTHHDPRCEWSTVALCKVVATLLSGGSVDLLEVEEWLSEYGAPREVGDAVLGAKGAALVDFSLDDQAMGFTLKALQVGLWATQHDMSFDEVVTAVILAGGDTDTNGAVVGAVLGARIGTSGILAKWIRALPDPASLNRLADALLAMSNRER